MLQYNLTRQKAGITLWGDPWTLRALHELIHRFNEESPVIGNKEGYILGLAYDIRKAFEGAREKDTIKDGKDSYRIYGVKLLWPSLIAQVGVLRASMAFTPTTRLDQALIYEVEGIIESAAKEAMPGKEDLILAEMQNLGSSDRHIEKTLSTRLLYFVSLSTKERMVKLPQILASMTSGYYCITQAVQRDLPGIIPPREFDVHQPRADNGDWPDFKW
ncbi:MAG: hypothetical protein FPO08_00565 [Geobacter sp.]|nr:MAG: hypothetical protein FPO08_00565 [Geobacter sp.]